MLEILILSLILSVDALSFGIAFGMGKIKISAYSLFIISATGFGVIAAATALGSKLKELFPFCDIIGALLLIGIGLWICADSKNDSINIHEILDNPKLSDINKSGTIEVPEAIVIGITLSIDCFGAAMGTGMTKISSYLMPVSVMIMQIIFLIIGIKTGKKIKPDINYRYAAIISGLIVVMIGFYRLLPTFY